jgi:hypothetical protein
MSVLIKNVAFALIPLAVLLALDFLFVRTGGDEKDVWDDVLGVAVCALVPVGFYLVNKPSAEGVRSGAPYVRPVLLTVVFTVVWLVVGFITLVNFHLAIGGDI